MPATRNLIALGFLAAAIVCAICHYTGILKRIILVEPILRKRGAVMGSIESAPVEEQQAQEQEYDTIYDADFEPESYGTGENWAAWEGDNMSEKTQ
jgi:hypothetical protein